MPTVLRIPAGLEAQRRLGPDWAAWLDLLPARVADLVEEWELRREGAHVWHGHTSVVLPVRMSSRTPAVLKVTCEADEESRHEALALQHWAGDGAARLFRADPHRRALLLERLHVEDLDEVGDGEACEMVGSLYGRLHRAAPPQLRTVTSYVAGRLDALAADGRSVPLPRRMVQQALSLGRELVADAGSVGTLVHGDLHYANVLAADREPWLAIDPKPMSGDPHYEPAPMLWNRWDEVDAGGDVRAGVRRRFHTLVDTAGLDEDRARDWVVVRSVLNAHWTVAETASARRGLDDEDRAWVTACLAVAKAVQD